MEKNIFFAPDILANLELPEEEAKHCTRVLRKTEGDMILITDGKGHFFAAEIISANVKHCLVQIIETIPQSTGRDFRLQIAFAPTKNMDRVEWFAEKATEIGIDSFTPLLCQHSERKEIKHHRLEKILVSAMKQSQKATLPLLDKMTSFSSFIKKDFHGRKFIAHCHPSGKELIKKIYNQGEDALILIGPEGDFSEEEVNQAITYGFEPISLGQSRLRTETAALVACHTIHVLNQ
ncbi:16S rRNA (uracil1498-N3)-methyltransferase [Dysgonomonas sp. PH5-45]|uniref:16S rRNA (uracil(1498)-N(3))-methyltransferase n=1 Tax=unclassified Dysgonomonas TaxID=2630389 RepID=UPI00247494CB|nr:MULTISPECIES: 16S rRNA (uracil(1498)-N(3))-methyltransferase [unclassified Dysgonomonas]MDH6354295.1 16S rRNA (uracil1498-N3)-methyltransferase [Dysgonomonas sp. PH5-45]MDH6387196.1 16S rRNA (uracil1498-N3)-methyltransferase [Dysgonomonas sp. PH5-37]